MTTQTATFAKARGGKALPKLPTPIKISEDCLRDLKEVFKLLSDGNRLKIDDLMPKLAEAMAQDYRAALFRDH